MNIIEDLDSIRPLATLARKYLQQVKKHSSIALPDGSRALLVFDPRVTRRLHTVIPIRVVDLPEQADVWDSVEALLLDLESIDFLRKKDSILSWEVGPSVVTLSALSPTSADLWIIRSMGNAKTFGGCLCPVTRAGNYRVDLPHPSD